LPRIEPEETAAGNTEEEDAAVSWARFINLLFMDLERLGHGLIRKRKVRQARVQPHRSLG
jgi:hypothetical protein